jgi:hypothetical protein
MSAHWVDGVGAVPAATHEHVPIIPGRLQSRQAAAQPVSQQTPCSQYPDAHIAALVQAVPFVSCVQTLPMQL